ncbi:segregation/condensation protein A [Streptomyces sp. NPDC093228]|uniref:segregation/condensation protein A n=1 Tax=Streptomyces sp. NPDC093228 TaxID=3155070 RepID=UPI0007412733|nr:MULTISPECIES: segregation/condensation protein A [unclassified Streptomyces]KUJ59020.1 chromosome segregation protein ScpA [Streptomyces sp. NRRL F-5122]MDX3259096.1 segregation/condensation protein A [Streptomyces sp. MI02-2A]REE59786.1 condensin subunit ScpA [Streptomyces sp. 3212.3]
MTSYDGSTPSTGPVGRRRALGRGPGAAPVARVVEEEPAALHGADAPEEAPPSALSGRDTAFEEPAAAGHPGAGEPPAEGRPARDGSGPAEAAEESGPYDPPGGTDRSEEASPGATAEEPVGAGPGSESPEASVVTVTPEEEAGPDRVSSAVSTPSALTAVPQPGSPTDAPDVAVEPADAPVEPSDGPEPDDGVFKVRLSNFEGPFDLLLQLISKHKLDVTEVALSKVTDEFMGHIRAMGPDWNLDETTEFLVVAATLLDLKAARLLPAAEVEDEADLALLEARDLLFARLLQYRAYKQIAEIFNRRTEDEARRYPRTVGLEPQHAELLPEVVISIGPEGFAGLAVKAMQPKPKPQVYVDHIHAPLVSVQEQAQIVVARLRELGAASFRVLVADSEDTLTVVARFLALLELYREKAVALEQEDALGELLVRWTGGEGDEAPVVTDEFDRPPEDPEAKADGTKTEPGRNGAKTEEKA